MAYSFNGTNQYITTASAPATAYPITISALAKPTGLTATQSAASIAKSTDDLNFISLVFRGATAGDPLEIGTYNAGASTTVGYQDSVWQSAIGVLTSTTSRTVYLDGGNKVTNTISETAPSGLNRAAIGVNSRLTLVHYFNGPISEVAIWTAALTDAEAVSLSKGFKPTRIRPQSLVFYAPLIRNLQDISKGGRTLTNNNTATVSDHPRVY